MTIERDVVVKLKAIRDSASAQVYKQAAEDGKKLSESEKAMVAAQRQAKAETEKLTSAIEKEIAANRQRAAQDREFITNRKAVVSAIEAEIAALRKKQALEQERIRRGLVAPPGQAGQGGQRVGGQLDGTDVALGFVSVVTGFGIAIKAGTEIFKAMTIAAKEELTARQKVAEIVKGLPLGVGELARTVEGWRDEYTGVNRSRRRESGLSANLQARLNAEMMENEGGARIRNQSMDAYWEQQIARDAARRRMQAVTDPRAVAMLGNEATRDSALRRIDDESELFKAQERARILNMREGDQRKALSQAEQERQKFEEGMSRNPAKDAAGQKSLEAELQSRINKEHALTNQLADTLRQRREAELQIIERQRSVMASNVELMKDQSKAIQEQVAKQKQLVEQEKNRLANSQSQFALLSGKDKLASLQAAELLRTKGLKGLNREQAELLGRTDIGRQQLEAQARAAAGQGGAFGREFEEFSRATGAANRLDTEQGKLRELEAKGVQVNHQIAVQVQVNEETLAKLIGREAGDAIKRVTVVSQKQIMNAANQERRRAFLQQVFANI